MKPARQKDRRRPEKAGVKTALTGKKVVQLLRQGQAIRTGVERQYARLQQITAEDLQFTSR